MFCTEEQIEEEALRCLDFGFYIYEQFGLKPRLELSTRPEKRVGTDEMWDKAEAALQRTLEQNGLEYDLNEGDGAFYGPKIDAHITDAIGRSWQLGTVQLDYYMPEQFELDLHRRRQRRAPAGDDPPRADGLVRALHRHPDRALRRRVPALAGARAGARAADRRPPRSTTRARSPRGCARPGLRVEVDERSESIGKKIREAEVLKVPYMLVVGDAEQEAGAVAVRRHREGDLGSLSRSRSSPSAHSHEIAERR